MSHSFHKSVEFRISRVAYSLLLMVGLYIIPSTSSAAVDPAVRPSIKDLPGLAYRSINLQVGGFLASELVYRSSNTASDISTNYSRLPFANSPGHDRSELRGSERQSRLSLLAQGDLNDQIRLAGYYEIDFLGTTPTANAVESNSYAPRTRNVYGTADSLTGWHLLAGQSWSLLTLNQKGIAARTEMLAPTIDSQFAIGVDWARQWQLRLAKDWESKYWAAVSLENAQTTNVTGQLAPGTGNTWQLPAGSNMSSNLSFNAWPDLIIKLAADPGFGHFELYGLTRNFRSYYGGPTAVSQTIKQDLWTTGIGGGFNVPLAESRLNFVLTALYGQGIGRYGTSTLADATFAGDGSLEPLPAFHFLSLLTWHLDPSFDIYAAWGQERVGQTANGNGSGYGDGAIADLTGCDTLGGTCAPHLRLLSQVTAGCWWTFAKGDLGLAKLGLQYSLTDVYAYADQNGLAPTTDINMGYVSLRYYPF